MPEINLAKKNITPKTEIYESNPFDRTFNKNWKVVRYKLYLIVKNMSGGVKNAKYCSDVNKANQSIRQTNTLISGFKNRFSAVDTHEKPKAHIKEKNLHSKNGITSR